jgi:hypothetical protein
MKNLKSISSVFGRKLTFTVSPEDGPFFKFVEKFKLKSSSSSVQLHYIFTTKEIGIVHLPKFLYEYLRNRIQGESHNNSKWSYINNGKLW